MVNDVTFSHSLFPYISEFELLPFDHMTSDAHSGSTFPLLVIIQMESHTHMMVITLLQ